MHVKVKKIRRDYLKKSVLWKLRKEMTNILMLEKFSQRSRNYSNKGRSVSVFRGFLLKLHEFATSRHLMSTMEELSAETPFIKD